MRPSAPAPASFHNPQPYQLSLPAATAWQERFVKNLRTAILGSPGAQGPQPHQQHDLNAGTNTSSNTITTATRTSTQVPTRARRRPRPKHRRQHYFQRKHNGDQNLTGVRRSLDYEVAHTESTETEVIGGFQTKKMPPGMTGVPPGITGVPAVVIPGITRSFFGQKSQKHLVFGGIVGVVLPVITWFIPGRVGVVRAKEFEKTFLFIPTVSVDLLFARFGYPSASTSSKLHGAYRWRPQSTRDT